MHPHSKTFVPKGSDFFQQALQWAQQFDYVCALDHNHISYPFRPFERMIAVSNGPILSFENSKDHLKSLQKHLKQNWLFGFLSYDLKNEVEALHSSKPLHQNLPLAFFFEPICLIKIHSTQVEILSQSPADEIWEAIKATKSLEIDAPSSYTASIYALTDKASYISDVERIQQHIENGDVYELNYCMAYEGKNSVIEPLKTFLRLCQYSPMPFASFMKIKQQYVLCASPERFLKKEGQNLISQPIKGTIRRGKNVEEDEQLKWKLRNDEKERAENMMIVDLVRNDLARVGEVGKVKVEEIFGIYTFKQLHQMISTISAQIRPEVSIEDILKATFPMGSMTGAPKVMAMKLIDQYEKVGRGLFSGAIGYISPQQDFDFNVVIRTLFYDAEAKELSFQVGSAITYDADATREYEECLLKAAGILKALGASL